jgi:hypothetical protein
MTKGVKCRTLGHFRLCWPLHGIKGSLAVLPMAGTPLTPFGDHWQWGSIGERQGHWFFVAVTKFERFKQMPLPSGVRWCWLHGTKPGTDGDMVAT